jgi:hypothetical protein
MAPQKKCPGNPLPGQAFCFRHQPKSSTNILLGVKIPCTYSVFLSGHFLDFVAPFDGSEGNGFAAFAVFTFQPALNAILSPDKNNGAWLYLVIAFKRKALFTVIRPICPIFFRKHGKLES